MNEYDKKKIIDRYNNRIEKNGVDQSVLAVGSEAHHQLRFKILSQIGDLNSKKILDLGCGFGDLYAFFNKGEYNVNYTGYDINPMMISEAKRRHPSGDFFVKDIFNQEFPTFDYILSSTAFNLKMDYEDNYALIEKLFKKCYTHSNIGFGFDFLTSYVDYTVDGAFYYSPEKVFSIAKKISKKVTLKHDYELYEFSIFVYKDFEGWYNK